MVYYTLKKGGNFDQLYSMLDLRVWPLASVLKRGAVTVGSCHKRQKAQAPTLQAPIRNRQTRKAANAKGFNRNTSLT